MSESAIAGLYNSGLPGANRCSDASIADTFLRWESQGLVDDIGALRPTIFIGVPRVFDRIYSGVLSKIQVG